MLKGHHFLQGGHLCLEVFDNLASLGSLGLQVIANTNCLQTELVRQT